MFPFVEMNCNATEDVFDSNIRDVWQFRLWIISYKPEEVSHMKTGAKAQIPKYYTLRD